MKKSQMEQLKINKDTLPMIENLGEILPGGFFIYHAYGAQELISFNRKMIQLFGCDTEEEFRTLVGNSFKGIVHPDEYEEIESSIRRQIAESSDKMDHVKYRFIRRDGSLGMMDDYGHFSCSETFGDIYYVFVQDVSEQYEEELEKERLAEQQRKELITLLTGSESTYIVYHDTERFIILGQNSYLKNNYTADESFTESITRYIETDVYAPDRASAKEAIALESIAGRLKDEEKFSFRYRDSSSGIPRWYELRAARLSDSEILCSFSDVDDEVAEENIYEKFQENYFGLYYVSLESGFAKIIRSAHPDLTGEIGSSSEYAGIIHNIASSSKGEAVEFLNKISSIDYLKERFREDELAYYYYQSYIFEEKRWISVTGRVLKRNADGTPEFFGLGFSLMDETASERERIRAEAIQDELDELIGNISKTYDIVYFVNMDNDSVTVHKIDESMSEYGHDFPDFSAVREFFLSNVVHQRDKERMSRELSFDIIKEHLVNESSYTVEYGIVKNNATLWGEMNVISVYETHIIIGMAERDLEIEKRRLEEKRYGEYMALYMVDVDTGTIRPQKTNELYRTLNEGSVGVYRDLLKKFSEIYTGETKKFFMWISDLENIKELFSNSDKFTFVFKSVRLEHDFWIELVSYCLLRHEDGSPAVFTLGFTPADALASEMHETQTRANAYMQMISGLAGEYYALYYYNINERIFSVYALDKERFPQAADMVASGGEPIEILRKFGTSQLVHPDDRAAFACIDIAFVKTNLAHSKKYSVPFRRIFNGEYQWAEMDIIKYEDYDEPANAIAIGFAERDLAIRSQQALKSAFSVLNKEYSPDEAIDELLAIAGEFYGADRGYIFENRKDVIDNTYEWCSDGIEAEIDKLQNVPIEVCAGWYREFRRQGAFFMDALDSEHNTPEAVEILKMQGIESLIAAPIYAENDIVGYIGVDNPKKSGHDVVVLQNIANVAYSQMLERNELNRAEDKVRDLENQQRYVKTFGDMINAALWNMNIGEDNVVKEVYWSDDFRRMLGYEETEEAFPNTLEAWSDLLHPDDRERVLEDLRSGIQTTDTDRYAYDVEYRILRKNGEYCWYHAVGRMENTENGDRRFYGIITDISADKELESAYGSLRESTLRSNLIHDFVRASQWSYRISACGEVLSAKYDSIVDDETDITDTDPMSWVEFLYPEDKEQTLEKFMDAVHDSSGNTPYEATYRLLTNNGSYRWTKTSGILIPCEDGTAELIGISIDIHDQITEQEKHQAQLAEALSMAESANKAKTTFLNNMSHDIRTPMNAIIGYTGLAASHIDNKSQVQDYLGKIAQSSDHLLSLINDVLDMSRIESGKINLDEKEENLPEIIHTLRDIVQADIHSRQHDFYIDTVTVNDENIICDKLRLNQVLLNILSNSIKYTAAGGTISMRITEKNVKASGYATYEFLIKDNGMGMDEEYLKTIFEPFTRVNSSTISGIQGTGLGMAITKNIIDMMGGRIDIKSAPGKGTETTVTFDFKLAGDHKDNFEIPEFKGLRALIADDDANTCVSIESMLSEIGMRSEWCTSGKEAVFRAENAYHRGDLFRVYIIDWLMPDMNGIETTRRIRQVIGEDVPIIILTAYDWSDIEEEARAAGVTAFISKPMFMSDLNNVLCSCLGRMEESLFEEKAEYDFIGKKILLVEDNELNREIAEEILEENGFIIDTAEDGTIAVEKMREARTGDYDLILMDIQMPLMDGYEATRQIRALGTEISKLPIIAMTANAFEEDRRAALEAGMNEHISKPIDVENLKETLARFL